MNATDVSQLVQLAKQGEQRPFAGAYLQQLSRPQPRQLEHNLWLLVLEGELIVDLPYGDFRILKAAESVTVYAPLAICLTPVEATVVLEVSLV